MEGFQLLELPLALEDNVLGRLDALEICRFRACNKYFYQVLTGPDFVFSHNIREDNGGGSYSLFHIEFVDDDQLGYVFGFRIKDVSNSSIMIDLNDGLFLNSLPGDILTFVCCSRSNLVFSRLREGGGVISLMVYDFIERTPAIRIPCPQEFVDHMQHIKITTYAEEADTHFRIIHVLMDDTVPDPVPLVSVFDSSIIGGWDEWFTLMEVAHEAPHGDVDIDLANEDLMIIPHGPEHVYFVTFQDEVPMFSVLHIDNLFLDNVQLNMSALNVRRGWNFRSEKYYATGDQGWATNIITHVNAQTGATIIKEVILFQFNPIRISYEYKARIDHREHEGNQHVDIIGVSCEASDHVVQVGLVLNHGVNSWSCKMFVFDIDSGKWTYYNTPVTNDTIRVGLPRLTSRLTL